MKTLTKISVCIFLLAGLNNVKAETPLDFDGDGVTDFGIVRDVSDGSVNRLDWYINRSSDGTLLYTRFGLGFDVGSGDALTPADFDGDGKTDIAVWRSSPEAGMSVYYILKSSDGSVRTEYFGQAGDDATAVGDYDGDGIADPGAYRVTQNPRGKGSGFLYRGSRDNPAGIVTFVLLGGGGQFRYPGDFDGDGKLDFCVRSQTSGVFKLKRSSDFGTETISWGLPLDRGIPGDFDGDLKSDFAVVRVVGTELHWFILERDGGGTGATPIVWGGQVAETGLWDDAYTAGDYDRDGKTDIGFTRDSQDLQGIPGSKTFFVKLSGNGSPLEFRWGLSIDRVLRLK